MGKKLNGRAAWLTYGYMNALLLFLAVFTNNCALSQHATTPGISSADQLRVINRSLTIASGQGGKTVLHLDARPGAGVAWIKGASFTTGTVTFDVKGKNILQQSFVGIAFHGVNDTTYEAIYFRPFNFLSADTARKSHAVQYISLPQYDWPLLREKFTGVYEKGLTQNADPESWLQVTIAVRADSILVYINGDNKPSLAVKRLANHTSGMIGVWVGNNSDGDFAAINIENDQ